MVRSPGKSRFGLAGRCPSGDEPAAHAGSRRFAASWSSANGGTAARDLPGDDVLRRGVGSQRLELPNVGDTSRDAGLPSWHRGQPHQRNPTERAPFFFSPDVIERAFQLAERQGHFRIDAVSPAAAAAKITAPVLLIRGEKDSETSADHSRRVFADLRGAKRLIIVPGAGHNGSLRTEIWDEIERWLDGVLRLRPSR